MTRAGHLSRGDGGALQIDHKWHVRVMRSGCLG